MVSAGTIYSGTGLFITVGGTNYYISNAKTVYVPAITSPVLYDTIQDCTFSGGDPNASVQGYPYYTHRYTDQPPSNYPARDVGDTIKGLTLNPGTARPQAIDLSGSGTFVDGLNIPSFQANSTGSVTIFANSDCVGPVSISNVTVGGASGTVGGIYFFQTNGAPSPAFTFMNCTASGTGFTYGFVAGYSTPSINGAGNNFAGLSAGTTTYPSSGSTILYNNGNGTWTGLYGQFGTWPGSQVTGTVPAAVTSSTSTVTNGLASSGSTAVISLILANALTSGTTTVSGLTISNSNGVLYLTGSVTASGTGNSIVSTYTSATISGSGTPILTLAGTSGTTALTFNSGTYSGTPLLLSGSGTVSLLSGTISLGNWSSDTYSDVTKFEVAQNGQVRITGNSNPLYMDFYDTSASTDEYSFQSLGGNFVINENTASANRLTLQKTTGYFGIGLIPSYYLDVNGDINSHGIYRVNGNAYVAVLSGTLTSGTAAITDSRVYLHHPWALDTDATVTNVGALTVVTTGSTSNIYSNNLMDNSTFYLYVPQF
jgi:hypothetical protein